MPTLRDPGDTVIDGALDGKILVQAEGLYGDGANAYGFYNAVSAEDVGKNFILDVESGSKPAMPIPMGSPAISQWKGIWPEQWSSRP